MAQAGWRFWFQWVLATVAGLSLGLFLGQQVNEILSPYATDEYPIAYTAGMLVAGA